MHVSVKFSKIWFESDCSPWLVQEEVAGSKNLGQDKIHSMYLDS